MTKSELIKNLSEGYSTQSETANKFWLVLIISCILTITGKPNKEGLFELPFTLGNVNPADFFLIMLILICLLIIAFASAMIQAIRTRELLQILINGISESEKFNFKIHIQDLIDSTLKPTFNRVAPIGQYLLGKHQFFGDTKPKKWIKILSSAFYLILKIMTFIFIYFIPIVSIYRSWTTYNIYGKLSTINIPKFLLVILVGLTIIVTLILFVGDIKYFFKVMKKINKYAR